MSFIGTRRYIARHTVGRTLAFIVFFYWLVRALGARLSLSANADGNGDVFRSRRDAPQSADTVRPRAHSRKDSTCSAISTDSGRVCLSSARSWKSDSGAPAA